MLSPTMSVGRVRCSCEGGSHQLKLEVEEQERFHARFTASRLRDRKVAGALPEPPLAEIILRFGQAQLPQSVIGTFNHFHPLSPFVPFMSLPIRPASHLAQRATGCLHVFSIGLSRIQV